MQRIQSASKCCTTYVSGPQREPSALSNNEAANTNMGRTPREHAATPGRTALPLCQGTLLSQGFCKSPYKNLLWWHVHTGHQSCRGLFPAYMQNLTMSRKQELSESKLGAALRTTKNRVRSPHIRAQNSVLPAAVTRTPFLCNSRVSCGCTLTHINPSLVCAQPHNMLPTPLPIKGPCKDLPRYQQVVQAFPTPHRSRHGH
jgi:hypothetical protein